MRKAFRERALSFSTLSSPLRLVVGFAYAQLVVGVVLLLAGRHALVVTAAVSLGSFCAGWGLVLAGAVRSARHVAVPVLAASAALFATVFAVGGGHPMAGFALVVPIVTILLIPALVLTGAELGDWSHLSGGAVAALVSRVRSATAVTGSSAAIALLGGWTFFDAHRYDAGATLLAEAVPFIVTGMAIVVLVQRRGQSDALRAMHPHVPYRTLLCVTVAFVASILTIPIVAAVLTTLGHPLPLVEEAHRWDGVLGAVGLCWLAVAVFGAIRAWRAASVSVVFVVVFGVIVALEQARPVGTLLLGHVPLGVANLRPNGIQFAVASGSLAFLAILYVRHSPVIDRVARLLLALNVALACAGLLYELYDTAIAAGEHLNVAQAAVVLAALTWELVTSGESVTNRDSKTFPREARVLLFVGYVLLVSAAVLFFTAWPADEAIFDSESWPQFGILALGIPLILTVALLNIVRTLTPEGAPSPCAIVEGLDAVGGGVPS